MRRWYAVRVGAKFKLFSFTNKRLKLYDNVLGLDSSSRYGALKELDILRKQYDNSVLG